MRRAVASIFALWVGLTPVTGFAHHVPNKDVVSLYSQAPDHPNMKFLFATFDSLGEKKDGSTNFEAN